MCTIVVFHAVLPEHPLAVVANRDELLTRPSAPPRVLHESPRAIGGVDLESGGTWMGANAHGLFVGLTNQRSPEPPDPGRRSRGEVVHRALALRDAPAVESMLGALDAREYNGFNLIFGAPGDVRVAYARSDRRDVEVAPVPPGIVVLPNDRLRSPEFPKILRAEARAREVLADPARLTQVLADHAKPAEQGLVVPAGSRFPREVLCELQALCIHLPFYGTVSATAILYGPDARLERYLFAAGPPCTTPFSDVTALLDHGRAPGAGLGAPTT